MEASAAAVDMTIKTASTPASPDSSGATAAQTSGASTSAGETSPVVSKNPSSTTYIYYDAPITGYKVCGSELHEAHEIVDCWHEPQKATYGAAAFDLFAPSSFGLEEENASKINMKLKFFLPHGVHAMILPRSSSFLKNIWVHNGLIDSDYRGNLYVLARAVGKPRVTVMKGSRIAQILFAGNVGSNIKLIHVGDLPEGQYNHVMDTLERTKRGAGGMGSTGE